MKGWGGALFCRKLAAAAAAAVATRSEKSALNHRLAVKLFNHIVFFILTAIFLSFFFFGRCKFGGWEQLPRHWKEQSSKFSPGAVSGQGNCD